MTQRIVAFAVLICAVAGLSALPARAADACDPAQTCCVAACSGEETLPTAKACAADTCGCAQALHCVVEAGQPGWDLFPGSVAFQPTTRPVHGRYMTIRANPVANAAVRRFMDAGSGSIDIPDGSVIVKSNFPPDPETPGVPGGNPDAAAITTMLKLDGYCPQTSGATDQCVGGDWFFLLRVGDALPVAGKPGGCVNCHSAAEQGDWLWRLFAARRFSGSTEGGD